MKNKCQNKTYVPMTPIMNNLLHKFKELKALTCFLKNVIHKLTEGVRTTIVTKTFSLDFVIYVGE